MSRASSSSVYFRPVCPFSYSYRKGTSDHGGGRHAVDCCTVDASAEPRRCSCRRGAGGDEQTVSRRLVRKIYRSFHQFSIYALMVLLDGEKHTTVIQTRCPFGFLLRAKYACDKCRRRYLVAPVMMGFFSLSFVPNTGGRPRSLSSPRQQQQQQQQKVL
jgi:hypothetical protein